MKRVFLIVLDSFGCGEAPDAAAFGDRGADTLRSVAASAAFHAPHLEEMGLGLIPGVTNVKKVSSPRGAYGRMQEQSAGKDTTIGHWELAGIVSPAPLPVFPEGFPEEVIAAFSEATGRGVLCNRPYSGTAVIRDYGEEHLATGDLIVYTSADSVFQVAAHEDLVPPEELYEICRKARAILKGPYGVGRVIARPFVGRSAEDFTRTGNRRDFSLEPPGETLLDAVKAAGLETVAVGKISDIFAARGITRTVLTHSNEEGMAAALQLAAEDFSGLCFINLVEFDSHYGHRRDADGYARAISAFDAFLPGFKALLGEDDLLLITADHGCDPGFTKTTDHTREFVPVLAYGKGVRSAELGTRSTFADVAATVRDALGVPAGGAGESFLPALTGEG